MKSKCLLFLPMVLLILVSLACGGSSSVTPTAASKATPAVAKSQATAKVAAAVAPAAAAATEPAPTPSMSSEEAAYAARLAEILGAYSEATTLLGEKTTAAGENPLLMLDEDWTIQIATAMAMIRVQGDELRKLVPPARFKSMHADLLLAADHFDKATKLLAEGIDNRDAKKIEQAGAQMISGNEDLHQANAKMQAPASGQPAAPAIKGATAAKAANLRSGPGTTFKVMGGVKAGDPLDIVGKNAKGDWYKLATGAWIASFLVTNPPTVPVVEEPVSSAPLATTAPAAARSAAVAVPLAAKGPPTAGDSDCPCDGDTLNCDDFPASGWEAQACYLRCKELTGRDVHGLDRDSDGDACEWTY